LLKGLRSEPLNLFFQRERRSFHSFANSYHEVSQSLTHLAHRHVSNPYTVFRKYVISLLH
jgi:hypothetical protein